MPEQKTGLELPTSIVEFAERKGHMHRNTHVVLTSGDHSDTYGNYRFLGPQSDGSDHFQEAREFYVRLLRYEVCKELKLKANEIFWVGPETMGAVMVDCLACISYEDHRQTVDFLALEKDGPNAFKHPEGIGQMNPERKPVVFMDDVLTGGTTVGKAKPITDLIGGIHAVAVWMNRSNLSAHQVGVHQTIQLERIKAKTWTPEEIWAQGGPCTMNVPLRTDIGKPKDFLAEYPDYPRATT